MADEQWKIPPFSVDARILATTEIVDWGLSLLGVPDSWAETQGEGVRVAVLDTGAHLTHPDLQDAIADAADFTYSRYGPQDRNGHGTHCSGIVAARKNGEGCVGVAPKASLLVGKVLGDDGSGRSDWIIRGIQWAVDRRADIISMSLGSPSPDPMIRRAIQDAVTAGKIVVVAAGNSGPSPDTVDYPGAWPECIAIGSMNRDGQVSRYSSRGKEVCVVAPGEQITSCWIKTPLAMLSGTSMATPFVAGVVALMIATQRKTTGSTPLTQEAVRKQLQQTASDLDSGGFDPNAGWGLVDLKKLLAGFVPPMPPVPTPVPILPSPGNAGVWALIGWLAKQPWFMDFLLWLVQRFSGRQELAADEIHSALQEYGQRIKSVPHSG